MTTTIQNQNKIFNNIFDDMNVSEFFKLERLPENTDNDTMIRLANGLKEYMNLDVNMPQNIKVSEALLFLEITNNPSEYPDIMDAIINKLAEDEYIDKASPVKLFEYMKHKGILDKNTVYKEDEKPPMGEDFSKEELDALLKEADDLFK